MARLIVGGEILALPISKVTATDRRYARVETLPVAAENEASHDHRIVTCTLLSMMPAAMAWRVRPAVS